MTEHWQDANAMRCQQDAGATRDASPHWHEKNGMQAAGCATQPRSDESVRSDLSRTEPRGSGPPEKISPKEKTELGDGAPGSRQTTPNALPLSYARLSPRGRIRTGDRFVNSEVTLLSLPWGKRFLRRKLAGEVIWPKPVRRESNPLPMLCKHCSTV